MKKVRRGGKSIGYRTKMARMDRGAYHLVAVSKLPGIILDVSADRLWETLTGTEFTTPLLRGWYERVN